MPQEKLEEAFIYIIHEPIYFSYGLKTHGQPIKNSLSLLLPNKEKNN